MPEPLAVRSTSPDGGAAVVWVMVGAGDGAADCCGMGVVTGGSVAGGEVTGGAVAGGVVVDGGGAEVGVVVGDGALPAGGAVVGEAPGSEVSWTLSCLPEATTIRATTKMSAPSTASATFVRLRTPLAGGAPSWLFGDTGAVAMGALSGAAGDTGAAGVVGMTALWTVHWFPSQYLSWLGSEGSASQPAAARAGAAWLAGATLLGIDGTSGGAGGGAGGVVDSSETRPPSLTQLVGWPFTKCRS